MYQDRRELFEWVRLVEYGLFLYIRWELWTKPAVAVIVPVCNEKCGLQADAFSLARG